MKKILASLVLIGSSLFSYSQNVGIGTNAPHTSAALEIQDTSRGILIPRMTMAQRNAIQIPTEGLMVYQTDSTKGFWHWDGIRWKNNQENSVINNSSTPINFSNALSIVSCQSYSGVSNNNALLTTVNFDSVSAVYVSGGGAASLNLYFLDSLNNPIALFFEYIDSRDWYQCYVAYRHDEDFGFGESSNVTLGRNFESNSCAASKKFFFKFFKKKNGNNIVKIYYNNPGCSFGICTLK